MIKFNVASINCCTEIEGPNKRLTIWFQGCMLHCKGCCNPAYQPLEPRNIISLENLLKIIKDSKEKYGIDKEELEKYTLLRQNISLIFLCWRDHKYLKEKR